MRAPPFRKCRSRSTKLDKEREGEFVGHGIAFSYFMKHREGLEGGTASRVASDENTLSAPSVLSKRYGTLSSDESSSAARQIEDEAFSAASSSDGIETLQVYSKEISKRMLDTVKARAAPIPSAEEGVAASVSD
ncbi:MFP1 attachment factor 1 [Glycine soja]|uniref:MFP1 attachment factor 1 n=1 Tax=Glycine soja TaxID=3848 RepID=A0A0B2QNW5_GLYSO|nr:MFP1 attachment factor 1 [Glycine soja]